jgi:hypothetical protein
MHSRRRRWVRFGRADHLSGAGMCGRCSSVSGPIRGRQDRGSLGPTAAPRALTTLVCQRSVSRKAQHAGLAIAYCNEGRIAAPGPIFWRLPLMTCSPSETPLSTETRLPSVGPSETRR